MRTVKSCGPGTRCWCQVSRRFWRPDRAREAFNPRGDGDKKELVAGESAKDPVKTIAQGRSDDPGYTCGSYRVLFVARGPWVRRAPGLPCALVMSRDKVFASTRGAERLRGPCRVRLGRTEPSTGIPGAKDCGKSIVHGLFDRADLRLRCRNGAGVAVVY